MQAGIEVQRCGRQCLFTGRQHVQQGFAPMPGKAVAGRQQRAVGSDGNGGSGKLRRRHEGEF